MALAQDPELATHGRHCQPGAHAACHVGICTVTDSLARRCARSTCFNKAPCGLAADQHRKIAETIVSAGSNTDRQVLWVGAAGNTATALRIGAVTRGLATWLGANTKFET